MLWRTLKSCDVGFYLDVGAADPSELSVTRAFYERGWRGINLEPTPDYFRRLSVARPRDINLQVAAAAASGWRNFYVVRDSGLSTMRGDLAAGHRAAGWEIDEVQVEALTLAEICRRHAPEGDIHFLKIDVEGAEEEVLRGADFATFRPWIVLVEAIRPGSSILDYAGWEPFLVQAGYRFAWFDGLNRFYVAAEHQERLGEHFRVQPNVFDEFRRFSDVDARVEAAEARAAAAAAAERTSVLATETSRQITQEAEARVAEAVAHTARIGREALQRADAEQAAAAAAAAQITALTAERNAALARAEEADARVARIGREALQRADSAQTAAAAAAAQITALTAERNAALARAEGADVLIAAMRDDAWWRKALPRRPGGRSLKLVLSLLKQRAREGFRNGVRSLGRVPWMKRNLLSLRRFFPGTFGWLEIRYLHYAGRAPIPAPRILSMPDVPADAHRRLTPLEINLYDRIAGQAHRDAR